MKKALLFTTCVSAAFIGVAGFAQTMPAGPFTGQQAQNGGTAFQAHCAVCHQSDLQGSGEAPALSGTSFMGAFGNRPVSELYNLIKGSMPYGNAGSLDAGTYRNIVAFLLAYNGAHPGTAPLTGEESVKLSSVANGKGPSPSARAPATRQNALAQSASNKSASAEAPAAWPPGRFGLTVKGTVKNYRPVTNAMLDHPADGDWLMYRRTYQGWRHAECEEAASGVVLGDE